MESLQITLPLFLFSNYILFGLANPVMESVFDRHYCLQHNAIDPNMTQKLKEARSGVEKPETIDFKDLSVESVASGNTDHCQKTIDEIKNSTHNNARAACPW